MENRERTHRFTLRLSEDENRILEAKMRLNNDPSKSYVLQKSAIISTRSQSVPTRQEASIRPILMS